MLTNMLVRNMRTMNTRATRIEVARVEEKIREVMTTDHLRPRLRVCVATIGCQMNEYDSEVAEGLLEQAGFEIVWPVVTTLCPQ